MADADPGLLLHTADGGLGGQPGSDRLADAPQPAGVMGEHAVGFEHFALLAADEVAGGQHLVERLAQLADRAVEALQLGLRAFGQKAGDLDARLVEPSPADRHTLDQAGAVQAPHGGGIGGDVGILAPIDQLAGRKHLGQDRGDHLHRLDLVLGIGLARPVLHRQHAHDLADPQDRHAQERVVDLLAGLREIAEVGVALRVGGIDHLALRGDGADQALADAHPGLVHRLGREADGGEQLEHLAGAVEVDRADLGHEIGRDQPDDAVQPLLRTDRFGHHLDQPPEQHPRGRELDAPPGVGAVLRDVSAARGRHQATGATAGGPCAPRANARSACSSISARMAATGWTLRTRPTLWPAISEPFSTSPSTTARRKAPAQ